VMEYPKKQEFYLGYWNMSIGVGTCIGPIIGSILSYYLSYSQVFAVFTALIGLSLAITTFMLPDRLNKTMPARTASMELLNPQNVTYFRLLSNKTVLLILLMEVSAIMFEYYVDPILGPQFVSLGVPESNVGYGFSVIGGSFGLGSLFAGWLCSKIHRNYVIQIGSFF
jgi:predicted MFS family arabinose efflux permease